MQQRLQEENYWKHRWATRNIGWHLDAPHASLVEYVDMLAPRPMPEINKSSPTPIVFVPLSGKSLDIHWLMDQGYKVVGCELSEIAVKELFEEMQKIPKVYTERTSTGNEVEVWEIDKVKMYRCNFFDLGKLSVSAIFDRAALVALPADTRVQYTQRMMEITGLVPQLLIAFEHARNTVPPHSIPLDLVNEYYGAYYNIETLCRRMISGGIIEASYLLTAKNVSTL